MLKTIGDYWVDRDDWSGFDWEIFSNDLTDYIVSKTNNASVSDEGGSYGKMVKSNIEVRSTGSIEFAFTFRFDDDIHINGDKLLTWVDWESGYEQPYEFQVGFNKDSVMDAFDSADPDWWSQDEDRDKQLALFYDEDSIQIRDLKLSTSMSAYAATLVQHIHDIINDTHSKAITTQDRFWMR